MSGNNCYCNKCQSHHHLMDECAAKPDILKQPWYLLGQPWAHSKDSGMTILAGSEDPHIATFVCDLQPIWEEESFIDNETARIIAKYIVDLHNSQLSTRNKES